MEIKVLYEDENILALDKPVGLLVHPDGRNKEETLVDWINKNYSDIKDVGEEQILQNGEKIKRPGIVHRLDKDTSGVILVAKNKETFEFLKDQFKNRKTEKIYHAIVWGKFKEENKEGIIDKPIGRSRSDFRKWSAEYGAKGELREAVTEYKVLGELPHPSLRVGPLLVKERVGTEKISYLEVKPKTGRTHQIRVHLKAIGHPVVGDKLYGSKEMNHELRIMNHGGENNPPNLLYIPTPLKFRGTSKGGTKEKDFVSNNRLMLHAYSIKIELPNHTHITIESPLPREFEQIKNLLSYLKNHYF